MSFDERRGDAITAPPEPTVISGHTKINFVESGNDCITSQGTSLAGKFSTLLSSNIVILSDVYTEMSW